jgi:hypothetical protein
MLVSTRAGATSSAYLTVFAESVISGRSLRGEDEFCVEDDFSGAIRAVTGVIFGTRLLGRLIS